MFLRYFAVSLLALAIDVVLLALLSMALDWNYTLSAGVAYLAGAIVHYLVSRRYVFETGWLRAKPSLELGAFLASGACGAAITVLVVGILSDGLGAPLSVAKAAAVAVSFVLVYLLRSRLVFKAEAG